MPGTASDPAFRNIDVDTSTGKVQGLFLRDSPRRRTAPVLYPFRYGIVSRPRLLNGERGLFFCLTCNIAVPGAMPGFDIVNGMKKREGYVQLYTGTGKGKTTAALGLTVRALRSRTEGIYRSVFKNRHIQRNERAFLLRKRR